MQAQLPPPPRADLDTSWLPPMLHGAGYSHAELLKIGSIADPGGLAAAEAKLKGGLGTPVFRTLARLFYLGNAVPTSFVDEALPGRGAAALVEAGLARTRGPDVVASASLTSLEGVYTASDPFASDGHPLTPGLESVLPVGNATQITSQLLSREPAQLALDLGCGQGYLSAVVAGYASRVIATDVSDRALGFTRFNARMNGRTNVEVRRGSLLEPVADLRGQFDLIACNAPFVLWIKVLSALDPYYVLPILMTVTMVIQTKLNPTPPDPVQAKVMQVMPFVFSIFFFFFPAGLVLYWLVNNILSILQQWQIQRMFDRDKPAHAKR